MSGSAVRVVLCGESPAYAEALVAYLEHDPALRVVGTLATPAELLAALERLDPDLIIVDLELPAQGALMAIEGVMRRRAAPILVLDAETPQSAPRVAAALAAGALEVAAKASLSLGTPADLWATAVRSRIKRLATVRVNGTAAGRGDEGPRAGGGGPERPARVIAIGASTGGPPALIRVLAALPGGFPTPILVVQHIAPSFTEGLVDWLDSRVALPVRFAAAGAVAGRGIWVAPDDAHLTLDPGLRFTLDATTRRGLHRPSVDMLFDSVAAAVGNAAVGVVLTGMGRDGAEGVAAIRAAGGFVIAQDEASCAVFGMPRAAIESGADLVLALDDIGPALRAMHPAAAA
jgi:two-component system chemotaxis response regulator CheB